MPVCPYCRNQVSEDHLFCQSCGASLKLPEYEPAFCPHCGSRVSGRQEFCHECSAFLEKPAEKLPLPLMPVATQWLEVIRGHPGKAAGALAGGLVLLVLLIYAWWPGRTSSPPARPGEPLRVEITAPPPEGQSGAEVPSPTPTPAPEAAAPSAPAVTAPAAPGPPTSPPGVTALSAEALREQLQTPLQNLRLAQLRKNLGLYRKAYSPTFPNLEKKSQRTKKIWQTYDYEKLDYRINLVQPINHNQAQALVTWNVATRHKGTQKRKTQTQTYRVWFAKEPAGWRITRVEQVSQS